MSKASTSSPAGSLCHETPAFKISHDAAAGEFRIESPGRAPLRLACQAAVSQPGAPDASLSWTFEEAAADGDTVRWRFAARQSCWERKLLDVEITPREVLFRVEVEGRGAVDRVTYFAGFDPARQPQPEATFQHLKWAKPDWRRNWTGSPAVLAAVFSAQPNIPGPQQLPPGVSQRITCATTFGPETFNTFFAPPLYAYVFNGAYCAGLGNCCDPTNPEFRRQLADAVARAVAPDGLNADGFKVDFTGDLPRGSGYHPASDLWGMDLTHDYLKLIHDAMRNAKPDTVLETHCANPHFADVTEMLRLNDLFSLHEDVGPEMTFRAEMARVALPGIPIDTDNDPFISKKSWLDYLRLQPSLGIPSLYTLTHMSFRHDEPITDADWDDVRATWNTYTKENQNR